jgi:glutamate decarboxylase
MWLAGQISEMGPFELISSGLGIPAFAFRVKEAPYTVYDVSEALRVRGWLVPAYKMPPNLDHIAVLRVVVRSGFTRDLASFLLTDLGRAVKRLHDRQPAPETKVGFHH